MTTSILIIILVIFFAYHFNKKSNLGKPNKKGREQTQKYYEEKYITPYHIDVYKPVFKKSLRILNMLKPTKDVGILDVGCGMGEFAKYLRKESFTNYLGFDISTSGIDLAKKRIPEWDEKFIVHSAYELEDIDFDYKVVVAIEVLEHINDLKFISQLKSGTLLIGSVPNYWSSNDEHLRVYPNKLNIWWRFKKYMSFKTLYKHKWNRYRFVHIFSAQII